MIIIETLFMQAIYHRVFTNEGEAEVAFKIMGENKVPLGCFYDPSERQNALENILKVSIFPIFIELEKQLQNKYRLISGQINYTFCVFFKIITTNNLLNGFKFILDILYEFGEDQFDFFVNVECTEDVNVESRLWGTQVKVDYGNEHWQHETKDEEYPIWFLYIEAKKTILEQKFNDEQLDSIINSIISKIDYDYQLSYPVNK